MQIKFILHKALLDIHELNDFSYFYHLFNIMINKCSNIMNLYQNKYDKSLFCLLNNNKFPMYFYLLIKKI